MNVGARASGSVVLACLVLGGAGFGAAYAKGERGGRDGAQLSAEQVLEALRHASDGTGPALPEGDPQRGQAKAANCAGCHGIDGDSIMPAWPKLAGQHELWLFKQLFDFKSGSRVDPMMSGMVQALTAQDIADLAAWFALQEPSMSAADQARAHQGERLYVDGRAEDDLPPCVGCHGTRGRGYSDVVPGGFPRLAGQHAQYTAKALRDFRDGTRTNDYNGMMQSIAGKLSDEDILALSEYMAIIR